MVDEQVAALGSTDGATFWRDQPQIIKNHHADLLWEGEGRGQQCQRHQAALWLPVEHKQVQTAGDDHHEADQSGGHLDDHDHDDDHDDQHDHD